MALTQLQDNSRKTTGRERKPSLSWQEDRYGISVRSQGRRDQVIPTAAAAKHGGQPSRVTGRGGGGERGDRSYRARGRATSRSPAPARPRPSHFGPPPPLPPGSLKSPQTEMGVTAPGTGETKHRGGRGGARWGRRPRNEAGPRGPALSSSPRPHSPAPDSAPSPPPALQSRLRSAAARAPRCNVSPGKTRSSHDSKWEA